MATTYTLHEVVEHLKKSGISLKDIAQSLNLFNAKNTSTANASVLTKLCNGSLKSYNSEKTEYYTKKLIELYNIQIQSLEQSSLRIPDNIDIAYLVYYWDKEQFIHVGLLVCSLHGIEKGKFIYLKRNDKNEFIENIELDVKSIYYKNSLTFDILLRDTKHSGYSFISAHIGNKNLEEVEMAFCSYAGSMDNDQRQFAGIGIIQKIAVSEINKRLYDIAHEGVSFKILNALYERRLDLKPHEVTIYNQGVEIIEDQIAQIDLLKGVWEGYFLSKDIEDTNGTGGIVHFVLQVKDSGLSRLLYYINHEQSLDVITYNGMIKFPHYRLATTIVGQFEKVSGIPRIQLFLKYNNENLEGMINGWRSLKSEYFASPIVLKKKYSYTYEGSTIDFQDEHFLKEIKPTRYSYTDPHLHSLSTIIKRLQNIEKNIFNTSENTLKIQSATYTNTQYKLYKSKSSKPKLDYTLIGVSSNDTRKFCMVGNVIDFTYLDNTSEMLLSNEYELTPFIFQVNIKLLDALLLENLHTIDYTLTFEFKKLLILYYKSPQTLLYTQLDIDKNDQNVIHKDIYKSMLNFFTPYFKMLEYFK